LVLIFFSAGEFHFVMHFCKALFRLGGTQYLLPLAAKYGHSAIKIEFQLKEWSVHNEFLLLFTDAACNWLRGEFAKFFGMCLIFFLILLIGIVSSGNKENLNVLELLEEMEPNQKVSI